MEILAGEFAPGEVLKIASLEKDLKVSATPLREALRNLATDGLVELHAHGSARVASVGTSEAADLYETRLLIEPVALERSIAKGGAEYRTEVTEAWQALSGGSSRSSALHGAFHRALLSACDSAWMLRVSLMLADRAGLVIAQGLSLHEGEYDIRANHQRLFELAMAGDAAAAADELTQHLRNALELFNQLVLDQTN